MSKFVNVTEVVPAIPNVEQALDIQESVVIRDQSGRYIESLFVTTDGNFQGALGRVRREDVGEYAIRRMGHPSARNL